MGDDPLTELQRLGQEFDATDQEAVALVEPRIIVRAAKCGHHFDEGCNACNRAEQWTNAQLDELRAQLAERDARIAELERSRAHILEDAKQGREAVRQLREDDKAQLAQAEADKVELMEALDRVLDTCGARGTYHSRKYADAVETAETTLAKHRKAST